MKKSLFAMTILFGMLTPSFAQPTEADYFYFRKIEDKVSPEVLESISVRSHYMGDNVGKKLDLIRDSYTRVVEGGGIQPTPTTYIDKPAIYYSVKKLEKYYKKAVKSGFLDKDEAASQFEEILDIAIFIRNQPTADFEIALENIKEDDEIVTVYTQLVSLSL